ncbi:hypothetical protein K474DRAFT_1664836 [Panus rudis PR-1116 ss-1]|nr:hypothetical protein K474DRAFT_1664836 [Panus rudis PR-1116 ss-1]
MLRPLLQRILTIVFSVNISGGDSAKTEVPTTYSQAAIAPSLSTLQSPSPRHFHDVAHDLDLIFPKMLTLQIGVVSFRRNSWRHALGLIHR